MQGYAICSKTVVTEHCSSGFRTEVSPFQALAGAEGWLRPPSDVSAAWAALPTSKPFLSTRGFERTPQVATPQKAQAEF